MNITSTSDILGEYRNLVGNDDITKLFFDSKTNEFIGYSFDDDEYMETINYVDRETDLNKIWEKEPDAISWDGWEKGIIGHIGSHLVYDVDLACVNYASDNNIEVEEALDHWCYNVEGSRYGISISCIPYHIYTFC